MAVAKEPACSSVKSLARRSSFDSREHSKFLLMIKVRISATLICEREDGFVHIKGSLAKARRKPPTPACACDWDSLAFLPVCDACPLELDTGDTWVRAGCLLLPIPVRLKKSLKLV